MSVPSVGMSETDLRIEPGEREWTRTAEDVLDEAVDRDERIVCAFDELRVGVPVRIGADAPVAQWELDGSVEITVRGDRGPLADWLQFWEDRG